MRIDIITIFPEMFEGPFTESIIKRGIQKGLVEIHLHNLRDYSNDKHKRVDDYAFSSGAGMVMMIEPVDDCISKLKSEREYDEVIYTSPDGDVFDQKMANNLSLKNNLIILCGHYKGIDHRIREHLITKEISVGDFVLTGGELPAMILVDAVARYIPSVLGNNETTSEESFNNNLLDYPVYTKPRVYNGMEVPEVLLSGDHKKINEWRMEESLKRTRERRPDLLD